MDDMRHNDAEDAPRPQQRRTKRGAAPIRLRAPRVVPISDEDHQQAVTALATMIASWWHDEHTNRSD